MHNNKFKLTVNGRVEIIKNEKSYKALIVDIEDDNIKINIPVNEDGYLLLDRSDVLEMNSYYEDGNCYNYYCDVLSKGKDNNIIYYKLTKPYNIKRIQRRNFVRVQVLKEIEYIKENGEHKLEVEFKRGIMVDLSGGGLRIKTKDRLKRGDKLFLNLVLGNRKIQVYGEVMRTQMTTDNERLCGIKFVDITQAQSDSIIKELFEIMRRQRANR